jgi:large subunit ribosomal protein L15
MNLDDVHRGVHGNRKRKRIGRGPGSGHGKTATRGHKGQQSRTGSSQKIVFEGGKMPLIRRIPKRGFNNRWAKIIAVVNVGDLEKSFQAGDEVTPEALKAKGLSKYPHDCVKILGNGELTVELKVSAHQFSQSAIDKIQKVGGQAVVIPGPAPVVKNKQRSAKQSS